MNYDNKFFPLNIEVGNVGIYSHVDEDTHNEIYNLVVFGDDLGPEFGKKCVIEKDEKLKNKCRNKVIASFIKIILESGSVDANRDMKEEFSRGLWGYKND